MSEAPADFSGAADLSGRDPNFSGRARRDPDFVAAASLELEYEPVPAGQVVSGSPVVGFAKIGEFGGHEYGVWEHGVGSSMDVEDDEVFVVLFGAATVSFDDGTVVTLGPGSVGQLREGQRTVWTVRETLRKVYFS